MDSVIISSLRIFLQKLEASYRKSASASLINRISKGFHALMSGSAVWAFASRPDYLTRIWEHSVIFRLLTFLFNLPARFFGYLRLKSAGVKDGSLALTAVKAVVSRYEITAGLLLACVMLIRHQNWDNINNTLIVLLLFFLYYLKAYYEPGIKIDLKSTDVTLVLFMLASLAAAATSVNVPLSVRFAVFYITGFLLVLIIADSVKTGIELNRLLEVLLTGVTLTGVYGLYQSYTGAVPVDPSLTDVTVNEGLPGRIYSTMDNANNFAEFLVLTLPFYAAVILNAKKWLKKLVFFCMALPPAASLLLTLSRSGMIALAFAAFVFLFFKNRRLIPALLVLGLAALPFLPQFIYRRILSTFNPNDSSAGYRILIYRTVWPMLKDFWATGIGLGTDAFMQISQRYFQFTKVIAPHSHNVYLQVWLESGLAGIITFLWFLGRTVKKCAAAISGKTDTETGHILMAGISALAGLLLMSLAEYAWFYPRVFFFFWMDIGVIYAGLRIISGRQEVEKAACLDS